MKPYSDYGRAKLLVEAIQELSVARTVEDVRAVVRTAARNVSGADGATFVMRDGDQCHYVDEDAIGPLWKGLKFPLESCISGWAMLNRRAAVIPDIYRDERIPHDAYRPTFVASLVMVPIRQGDPIGAIGTYWAQEHIPSDQEVELLQALADSTAVAMENVRMLHEVEQARLETLTRLAFAAEFRDDDTFQHTQRVARTACLLGRELGLSEAENLLMRQAASLHDIGKLAVPDAILLKPGRLTAEEFTQMKEHAAIGAAMLQGSHSEALSLAGEIALTHHEKWDGSGYPYGIAEHEIPLSGRIVAVADVFDSLTHARPYKSAWDLSDSVAEIRALSGKQFDPAVVEAFDGLSAQSLIDGDFGSELRLVA